jgi:hypothetical protein
MSEPRAEPAAEPVRYDGRCFRPAGSGPDGPVVVYRQSGDLLWAEFSGDEIRRGSLTGLSAPDGTLEFAYTMVRTDGEVISGRCRSVPEVLPGGWISLHEEWERYGPHAATGVSRLDEVPPALAGVTPGGTGASH